MDWFHTTTDYMELMDVLCSLDTAVRHELIVAIPADKDAMHAASPMMFGDIVFVHENFINTVDGSDASSKMFLVKTVAIYDAIAKGRIYESDVPSWIMRKYDVRDSAIYTKFQADMLWTAFLPYVRDTLINVSFARRQALCI